jgi:hypothetical protein
VAAFGEPKVNAARYARRLALAVRHPAVGLDVVPPVPGQSAPLTEADAGVRTPVAGQAVDHHVVLRTRRPGVERVAGRVAHNEDANGGYYHFTGSDPNLDNDHYYADVPPIKGVYRGPAESELEARVEMHRMPSGDVEAGSQAA